MFRAQIAKLLSQNMLPQKLADESNLSEKTITVHHITTRAAVWYEKVRYMVDYKEDFTIRRSAIERILKRVLVIENRDDAGMFLLRELVSAGYLPNNTIPESRAMIIQSFIDVFCLHVPTLRQKLSFKELEGSVLSIIASEIDAYLYPHPVNTPVVETFFETVKERIVCSGTISQSDFETQLFIACNRALLKSDDESVAYALWCRTLGVLPGTLSTSPIEMLGPKIGQTVAHIESVLDHPIVSVLLSKIKNDAICFGLIRELIVAHPSDPMLFFGDEKTLSEQATSFLQSKYVFENSKIVRSSVRAVVYIFLTKILIALGLEVPYEYYFNKADIDYVPLAINIVVHPLILFLMTRSIKPLGVSNTEKITKRLVSIVYGGELKTIHVSYKSSLGFLGTIFGILYAGLFALFFGSLFTFLHSLNWSIVSIGLFVLFLALVSYFGLRIRHNAQSWRYQVEEERILVLMWSFFTLPVIRAGRWLSYKFSSVNIFVFLLDVVIEAPFKLVLKIFDGFVFFLKEKKEETY